MPHVAVIIFVRLVRGKLSAAKFVSVFGGRGRFCLCTVAVRQSRIYVKFCRKGFVRWDEGSSWGTFNMTVLNLLQK